MGVFDRKKRRPSYDFLRGYGTIADLVKMTGVSARTLYRWRDLGVFEVASVYNSRVVLYKLNRAAQQIIDYWNAQYAEDNDG